MNFKSPLFPENSEKNRTKSGNLGKIVRFAIRTKPGIVLIEFVLSGDPLYLKIFQIQRKSNSRKNKTKSIQSKTASQY